MGNISVCSTAVKRPFWFNSSLTSLGNKKHNIGVLIKRWCHSIIMKNKRFVNIARYSSFIRGRNGKESEWRNMLQCGLSIQSEPRPLSGLHYSNLILSGLCCARSSSSALAKSRGLFLDFPQSQICEQGEGESHDNTKNLKARFDSEPKGLAIALFGFIIFAYSYWQGKFRIKSNWEWTLWLNLIVVGLLILAYGLNLSLEFTEEAEK